MTAVNYWEVRARARTRLGGAGLALADALLSRANVQVVAADADLAREAADAFHRFRGRPARLNLGDTFAYALAAREGDGLLYKGNDFTRTDVRNALEDLGP